uniref:MsrB domain-containing protein n=1 Tax=Haptolina brevifila TaxID=156173 RepID=A0A7S2D9N6_9EUKA
MHGVSALTPHRSLSSARFPFTPIVGSSLVHARHLRHTSIPVMKSLPDSEEGWMTVLSQSQFAVLRQAATEPPGYSERVKGELEFELKQQYKTKYPANGAYLCVGCGTPLYYAKHKFNSGCGWPAFYDGVPGAIEERPDPDGSRIEIVCNKCKGHLGHVFKGEGFPMPTDDRHCVNGICLKYEAAAEQPNDIIAPPPEYTKREVPE